MENYLIILDSYIIDDSLVILLYVFIVYNVT